jgi:5'-nucleotidase
MNPIRILLTNDDGIQSPGLWAAASALSSLGYVEVAAPRDQYSGAGRSLPSTSDGTITPLQMSVNGKQWTVYSVGGSPAQTVLHGVLEILPARPHLVVSGINYGENLSVAISGSGTVGAALEGASLGIPSMAVSLQTSPQHYLSYSLEVDFSSAAYFTALFARILLEKPMPPDVNVLKVDIPSGATPETPWKVTRLSHASYYMPHAPKRTAWDQPKQVGFSVNENYEQEPADTDVYALRVEKVVSVTPLSLDFTSRVPLPKFEALLGQEAPTKLVKNDGQHT